MVNHCREDAVVAVGVSTEDRRDVPVRGSPSFRAPSDGEPGTPVGSFRLGTDAVYLVESRSLPGFWLSAGEGSRLKPD